ncbi:hypothetical protein [Nocardia fusca]|uniref:hypothetical protein n=1 Tax=Nocardia fusca TaxID=941183 RepID=UPI0007A72FD0|nr:hypothetical protein [Nocardia fusca]
MPRRPATTLRPPCERSPPNAPLPYEQPAAALHWRLTEPLAEAGDLDRTREFLRGQPVRRLDDRRLVQAASDRPPPAQRSPPPRYETPICIFRRGGTIAVVLLHGETQWAKNTVAAGHARLRCPGGPLTLRAPRVVPPRAATAEVSRIARLGNRVAGVIVFEIDRPSGSRAEIAGRPASPSTA